MKKKRLTIGFITPRIYLGIHYSYFKGILDALNEYDINLLCFSGASSGGFYENDRQANIVFNFVSSKTVDGIICWTSGLFYKEKYIFNIEKLLKLNKNIPIVCIGKPLENYPTITTDNKMGISQLINHLVDAHNNKNIAFIRGPEYHLYAVERYQAYLKSMKKHGLQVNEKLIAPPGDFAEETGISAIKYYFDQMKLKHGKDIDVIVTASDLISLGAIRELNKRGISVPKDISVVGYNNRDECIEITPQITSVDLQFTETGKMAVKTIIDMLNKKNMPDFIYVPTKLVIRESCGCYNPAIIKNDNSPASELKFKKTAVNLDNLKENKNNIINILNKNIGKYSDNINYDRKWTAGLLNSLFNEIFSDTGNAFLDTLLNIIDQFQKNNEDIFIWQYIITNLYQLIIPYMNNKSVLLKVENIFHNSRVLVFQKLDQRLIIQKLEALKLQNIFPRLSSTIVTTFEISKMLSLVETEFPKVGIEECYMVVYKDKLHPDNESQLIMGFNKNGLIDLSGCRSSFQTSEILPECLFSSDSKFEMIVIPLFFQNNQLGYLLFKISNIDINLYYTLATYISSALQGASLVNDLEKRAQELKTTYDNLKENQERLLSAEKMASLGRMTAGIAHEMNTPLAAARNAINELGNLIKEYSMSINNPEVTPADHEEISLEMKKHFGIALKSIERGIGFIKGIKSQTMNIYDKKTDFFNASKLIMNTLILLEYMFKKDHCSLIKEIEEDILLYGDPQSLNQILTNIVINALDACRSCNDPSVRINLKKINNYTAQLIIKDNGSGISEENLSKIFDPFFTTKPFGENTGLGLSIVHELVEKFNGFIEVASKPGDTVFTVNFPLKYKKE